MTNKERLRGIEERVLVNKVYYKYLDGAKGRWGNIYTLSETDYNYLKEQAEQVRELEKENKRLREALEQIANSDGWLCTFWEAYERCVETARKTLEGEE